MAPASVLAQVDCNHQTGWTSRLIKTLTSSRHPTRAHSLAEPRSDNFTPPPHLSPCAHTTNTHTDLHLCVLVFVRIFAFASNCAQDPSPCEQTRWKVMLMESWDVKQPLFGETAGTPSVPPTPPCQHASVGSLGRVGGHCLGSAIHQIWREAGGLATCAKSCYTLLSCSPIFPQLVCIILYWVFSVGMQQLLRICSCYGVQLDILFNWNDCVILIVQTN